MLQGMQKKSLDRMDKQKSYDKEARVIGDSSRNKKLMQSYFEKKENKRVLEKKQRTDMSDRGMNYHQHSLGNFKNGALHINKDALARLEAGDTRGGAFKKSVAKKINDRVDGDD